MKNPRKEPSASGRRRWPAAAAVILGLAVVVAGTGYALFLDQTAGTSSPATRAEAPRSPAAATTDGGTAAPTASASSTSAGVASSTTTTYYTHAISDPARVVISAIGVDAKLIPVGMLENGDMEVPPFGLAGWYELGPKPGAGGPAVVVAHVDSKTGPDVFYRLEDMEPGDQVLIYDSSGDSAVFVVDSTEQQPKTQLPVERIWNDTWQPVLRLITCAGDFDRKTGHYLANLIVYAHLV